MWTTGFIKPYAWYIGSQYREDPMVKLTVKDSILADSLNAMKSWQASWVGPPLVDHWSFQEYPGEKQVVVFTNCDTVTLHLNGKLQATLLRKAFEDGVIKARIPYQAGELVARASYLDERGESRSVYDTLQTSFQPYALAMRSDRRQVHANSRDVVHITTEIRDSAGVVNPHGQQLVRYSLDGPGRIRVIDNGDLADHSRADTSSRALRRGKQLLILQAGSDPGDLIISASANGVKSSRVKIKSKH
jgi:beta-galactosidase